MRPPLRRFDPEESGRALARAIRLQFGADRAAILAAVAVELDERVGPLESRIADLERQLAASVPGHSGASGDT
jgi:hypothetical protein